MYKQILILTIISIFISLFPISSDFDIGNKDDFKSNLIDWMKDKLAPYEVPKIIELREELPLTLVGKVDKKLLRKNG